MLKDFRPRERKIEAQYEILFYDSESGGFAFQCDKDWNIKTTNECALKNYNYCMEHPEEFPYYWNEKNVWYHTYTENANGICECGNRVYLWDQYLGACECEKCGRWYNLFGQELSNPETWSEGDDW